MKELDLNLIALFEAVYEERNQSRAAERLGVSQPAVSHALSRLRSALSDHLFMDRTLTPTATAEALYPQIHSGLELIRSGFQELDHFDPATSHRHFHVVMSYSGGALFGAELYRRFKKVAPHVRLSIRTIDPVDQIPDLLRQTRIDLAITHDYSQASALCDVRLGDRELVLVARQGHPALKGPITWDQLWALDFVAVHEESAYLSLAGHENLRQLRQDRCKLELPNALLMIATLVETDLVAISIRELAQYAQRVFDLSLYELPEDVEPVPIHLVWHKSLEWESGHRWLREQVYDLWSQ